MSELILVACICGCESHCDRDEYYVHRLEGPVHCSAHGMPMLPRENSTED